MASRINIILSWDKYNLGETFPTRTFGNVCHSFTHAVGNSGKFIIYLGQYSIFVELISYC